MICNKCTKEGGVEANKLPQDFLVAGSSFKINLYLLKKICKNNILLLKKPIFGMTIDLLPD